MRIKVLQVVNTLDNRDGGPARNSFELNVALNNLEEVEAQLITLRGGFAGSVAASHVAAGGQLPEPSPRWLAEMGSSIARLGQLATLVRHADVVVIHGFFLAWVPLVAVLARLRGVPTLLMPHGALTNHDLSNKPRKKRLFLATGGRLVFGSLARLMVASPSERAEVLARYPFARIEVVGVGTRIPTDPPAARGAHTPVRMLTLSRIAPKKQLGLAVQAVRILLDRGVRVRLDIAGTGSPADEQSLRDVIVETNTGTHVMLLGDLSGPRKESVLARSDVFILASQDENFGISVAEAAAHGLPIVVSQHVAAALQISDVVETIQGLDAIALADGIERLIERLTPELRALAHRRAAEEFDWQIIAERWRRVIDSVLSERRAPA